MNHKREDAYIQARRNRMKIFFRLRLGIQQLVLHPYCIVIPVLLSFLSVILWKKRGIFFNVETVPPFLLAIYKLAISVGIILIPIIFMAGFLEFVGNIAARKDESDLIVAFSESDLRNGHPILIKRKKIKGTSVTVREFYSCIPMKIWVQKKDDLADQMNIHFVEPSIEYGGKHNDNGNRIRLYTAPGRKRPERGILYDNEI